MVRPARAHVCSAAAQVALAVTLGVPTAHAQAPTFTLRWDAPAPDCPDEPYVRAAVENLLGGEDPAAAHVEAHAQVERLAAAGWRVRLRTVRDGVPGERVVESSSCRSLADATAFILALAIDRPRVMSRTPPEPPPGSAPTSVPASGSTSATAASTSASAPESAPAPGGAPAPASTPAPAPASTPAPVPALAPALPLEPPRMPARPPSSYRVAAFVAFSGDLGTLPQAAYGFHLGGAILFPRARLEAYGAFWPSQHGGDPSAPSAGGDVFLADGGVRACWDPLAGAVAFDACPGLEVGVLHGQGTGVRMPRSSNGIWFAATALARIAWRFAPSWALFLDASLVVPFERDQFTLDQQTVHQAAPVEGRASAGPELRF
jgi:hypothetical protein